MKEGNFGLYRNSRFTMSEFVASEGKKDIAFGLLCEVVAYDLSGLYNGFRMDFWTCIQSSFSLMKIQITRWLQE